MTGPQHVQEAERLTALDTSFTRNETRLDPGIYLSDPQGHTLLVGTNDRSLTLLDMGGLASVAGLDVRDPDLLDRFADRLHQLADRLRARAGDGQ